MTPDDNFSLNREPHRRGFERAGTTRKSSEIIVSLLLWLAAMTGLVFAFWAEPAKADIVQTDSSSTANQNVNGVSLWQTLGTGLSGTATQLVAKYNQISGSTSSFGPRIYLYEYASEAAWLSGSATTNSWGGGSLTNAGTSDITVTTNFTAVLDPAKYYVIANGAFNMGTGRDIRIRGSATDVITGECRYGTIGATSACTGVLDIYFSLVGANLPPSNTTTRVENYQPIGTTTATTTVEISTDYYINSFEFPELNGQTWEVCLTGGNIESGPIILSDGSMPNRTYEYCQDATMDTLDSVSTTTLLQAGAWQAYAVLRNASTTETLIAKPYRFVVVSSRIIPNWPDIAGTASTTGAWFEFCAVEEEETGFWDSVNPYRLYKTAICWGADAAQGVITYMFFPSDTTLQKFSTLTLDNRFPFEYAYQAGDVFQQIYTADNGQDITISATTTIGTITFISPALIENWQPIPSIIKTVVTGILWYFALMYLYYRILRVHDEK